VTVFGGRFRALPLPARTVVDDALRWLGELRRTRQVVLTPLERRQYVQWWLTKSGLSRGELAAIATGLAFVGDAASRARRSEYGRQGETHP
jgi:hypothetical protein